VSGQDAGVASILEDLDSSAAWIATAISSSGYRADFSAASLWEVDRFIDEQAPGGKPKRWGLLSRDLGTRLFSLGAYVGDVVRREVGGEWEVDDDDPNAEVNVAIRLPDGSLIWPVQRVMKRLTHGAEDGIAAYASVLGVAVGPRPPAPTGRGRSERGGRRH
jgi:hypothetical protein